MDFSQEPPAPVSSAELAWRVLGFINGLRLVTSASLAVVFVAFMPPSVGQLDPALFAGAATAHVLYALISIGSIKRRSPDIVLQTWTGVFSDVLVLSLLTYASGGISGGLAALLVLSIGASSFILERRLAMSIAAASALALLVQPAITLFGDNDVGGGGDFAAAAVSSALTLIVSLGVSQLARLLRQNEDLIRLRETNAIELEEMQQAVAQNLREGFLVVDGNDRLTTGSPVAGQLLQGGDLLEGTSLGEVSSRLERLFQTWRRYSCDELRSTPTMLSFDGETQIQLKFVSLDNSSQGPALIFVDRIRPAVQPAVQLAPQPVIAPAPPPPPPAPVIAPSPPPPVVSLPPPPPPRPAPAIEAPKRVPNVAPPAPPAVSRPVSGGIPSGVRLPSAADPPVSKPVPNPLPAAARRPPAPPASLPRPELIMPPPAPPSPPVRQPAVVAGNVVPASVAANRPRQSPPQERVVINERGLRIIVGNVLQFARRDSRRVERIDLAAWVKEFLTEFWTAGDIDAQTVRLTAPRETVYARVDPMHLHKLLWTLCNDLLKYGRSVAAIEPIEIRVARSQTTRRRYLDIIDRGVVPGTERRVFEPFLAAGKVGTGVALYISRELAPGRQAQAGGKNQLRPGGGVVFRLVFVDAEKRPQLPTSSDAAPEPESDPPENTTGLSELDSFNDREFRRVLGAVNALS